MLCGNDIVDLQATRPHHPRFAQRIMGEEEYARFEQGGSQEIELWQSWAAKETTYKYLKRQDAQLGFSPQGVQIHLSARQSAYAQQKVTFTVETTADYVYCWASSHPHALNSCAAIEDLTADELQAIDDPQLKKESKAARALLCRLLERTWRDLQFAKDEWQRPHIVVNKKIIPVSLSHHGRFVAACVAADPKHL